MATAAAADCSSHDDSRRCATCSVQQRSRGSGSGKTFDGGAAFSRLSTSDHRRKDAQCIRYASGGSVATRTCVGLQRGLPGRRRAWQVQVALNRCYYMLNRRRRFTSATPSVLGDAICAPPAVSAVPDQLNARLDEEGGKKDRIINKACFVIVLESRVRAARRVYPFTPISYHP